MFTGIVAARAAITKIIEKNGNKLFDIERPTTWGLQIGESILVSGVCSTVIRYTDTTFTVEYMPETLRLTNLAYAKEEEQVNLEKSLTAQDALSGHFVYGHVDTMGIVQDSQTDGDSHIITIQHPEENDIYIIQKGSVTLNGVSLTVINPTRITFSVSIIPHTWQETTFDRLQIHDRVNIEYDVLAKYIEKMHNKID